MTVAPPSSPNLGTAIRRLAILSAIALPVLASNAHAAIIHGTWSGVAGTTREGFVAGDAITGSFEADTGSNAIIGNGCCGVSDRAVGGVAVTITVLDTANGASVTLNASAAGNQGNLSWANNATWYGYSFLQVSENPTGNPPFVSFSIASPVNFFGSVSDLSTLSYSYSGSSNYGNSTYIDAAGLSTSITSFNLGAGALPAAAPEPGALAVVAVGLAGLAAARRRNAAA